MILSNCKRGDKIILPRNVHKSAINALVLCGAVPVYVNPEVNSELGISLGMNLDSVKKAIEDNPDAVAVLVNNPTYYGICSDICSIVSFAHEHGMKVLADEAHGTHLYFQPDLPASAMKAGADMAAVSMHKSGGSLTQSSILLTNKGVNADYVRQIINLTQTTSGSYLLLASLDISRRNLALRGRESFTKVMEMAEYARKEINDIGGYYAYGKELVNGKEEVIQYEQRAPFDSLEFRFQCAFYFCHLKRTHKFRSIRIICPLRSDFQSKLRIGTGRSRKRDTPAFRSTTVLNRFFFGKDNDFSLQIV